MIISYFLAALIPSLAVSTTSLVQGNELQCRGHSQVDSAIVLRRRCRKTMHVLSFG